MNLQKVKEIIESYKRHFKAINKEEIYKWRAVKNFQDNWNTDAENFAEMLENSFAFANNLMASGQYFPKRMIIQYAQMDAKAVRELFAELYSEDEEDTLEDKWIKFHSKTVSLNKRFFGVGVDKKSYQDHRAFMVYLVLRFPERYFLFKFKMFKEFVEKVDFPYKPVMGRFENLIAYSELCEILRDEIIRDEELLEMHNKRLKAEHYIENSYNVLTQDVIYATVAHFEKFENTQNEKSVFERLIKVNKTVVPKQREYGKNEYSKTVDYIERQKANKRIGDFGERLIFNYEKAKLKQRNSQKEPEYIALTDDSRGFDILSYDENEQEIYIEVKTTKQSCRANFFITVGELRKSIEAKEKYRLYRVYDYNEEKDTGKFRELKGSLESFCTQPVLYKISVTDNDFTDLSEKSAT